MQRLQSPLVRSVRRLELSHGRRCFDVQSRKLTDIHDLVAQKKLHYINMPAIMDDKEGKVKKWLIAEGQKFSAGENICEMSFSNISIGYEAEHDGILAQIMVYGGQKAHIEQPIAVFALTRDDYDTFLETRRAATMDAEKLVHMQEALEEAKEQKPDKMVLLREIKHLIQEGHLEDGSALAKELQSLARHGHEGLMDAFEASFDGVAFNRKTFDVKFFLENAEAIVSENKK